MTERAFRLILGVTLLATLYADLTSAVWFLIGVLVFEGATNWRIPILVSRLRYGHGAVAISPPCIQCRFYFHAERALRLVVATLLVLTFVVWPDTLWFFPWFIGIMLTSAGLTNICPLAMALRWLGFKAEAA